MAVSFLRLVWGCLTLVIASSRAEPASAASSNASLPRALEWPYSETLASLSTEIDACARVSGFEFRSNTTPTARQLSQMCSEPSCIVLVTESKRIFTNRKDTSPTTLSLFRTFAAPVLDFCWYYRLPGVPCAVDPEMELYAHFPDKVEACEKRVNVSFRETNGTKLLNAVTAVATDGLMPFPYGNCSTPCYNLLERVYALLNDMPCKLGGVESGRKRLGIGLLLTVCMAGLTGYRYNIFKYHPEWPVPAVPPPIDDTPSPSGSDTGSGIVGDFEDVVEHGPLTRSPIPSRVSAVPSTPPKQAALTTSPTMISSSRSGDRIDPIISSPSSVAAKPTPTLVTKISDVADPPPASESPTQDVVVRASHDFGTVIGISAACLLLLCVMFFLLRRSRVKSKSNKSVIDSHYSSLASTPTSTTRSEDIDGGQFIGLSIHKTLPVDCIQDLRLIGMGSYGAVYLVRDTRNDCLLASKRLVNHQLTADKLDAFMDEIRLVSTLDHPCVVSFIGATWTNQADVQALFEFMDGGDLRTYLEATPVSVDGWTKDKITIAIDIADALHYVHTQLASPVVHRDLKSPNVLLTKQSPRRAKLSDFGVSRELSSNYSMTTGVGTGRWLAPEVILGGRAYDASCDIYSLGVVLTELDTHQLPFSEVEHPDITILSMVALEGRKPAMLESCPPKISELAQWCMSFKAEMRPTAGVVVECLKAMLGEIK